MKDDAAPSSAGGADEWLRALSVRHPRAIDMGLERAEKVRAALDLRLPMPAATIGGTNGKGSVCALADAMLRAGGARVGRYTSPHLLHFRERICINDAPASDETLSAAFAKVERARLASGQSLTYFEFTTLAAAADFRRSRS